MATTRNTKELLQALEATNKRLQGLLDKKVESGKKVESDKKEMLIPKNNSLQDTDKE